MAKSLLFVHGTGVRQDGLDETFRIIGKHWKKAGGGAELHPCSWGERYGSVLRNGASLGHDVTSKNEDVLLWARLAENPMAELDVMAAETTVAEWPQVPRGGERLGRAVSELVGNGQVAEALEGTAVDGHLSQAVSDVMQSPATQRVLGAEPLPDEAVHALARAIVAQLQWLADGAGGYPAPVDADTRDHIVAVVVAELGGSHRGLKEVAWKVIGLSQVTRPIERMVAAVPDGQSGWAGDVMLFLTRGDGIRRAIADAIAALPQPVMLLAHSLGGVAAVDLLMRSPSPAVETLVTVGSQAPYLYELDVLPALRFGEALPTGFPRWVNVYDPRDSLAFHAENVFPGVPEGHITDSRLDSRVPFPRSHSAYFANRRLYTLLASL